MMKIGMLEAARPGRVGKIGTGIRTLGLLVLGGSAASAAALIYPAKTPSAEVARVAPQPRTAQTAAAPAPTKIETRLGSAPTAPSSPAATEVAPTRPPVRQIPLIAGVDPTPATPPKTNPPPQQVASAATPAATLVHPALALAQAQASPSAQTVIASSAKAPLDCLPEGLRTVLQDVQARFGAVTLVSTRELHTDNHSRGSARHKMHGDCRAVDFKVEGDLTAITAYLRSRPEISGVTSYRNNRVIHIDVADTRKLAQR